MRANIPGRSEFRLRRMNLRELWQKPEARFLILFLTILGVSFTVVALRQVNDAFVTPYTAVIARMSGFVLRIFGEEADRHRLRRLVPPLCSHHLQRL